MNDRNRLVSTGVPGLDHILSGGLPKDRLYLVLGEPGVGKTTLALQFLLEGAARGESCVYITLSETAEELRAVADSHGWLLDGIHVLEVSSEEESLRAEAQYTMFHPAEIELNETTRRLMSTIDRLAPARLALDSLSELRLLARDSLRFRRQILALKQYLAGKRTTVLLLDDRTGDAQDQLQLQSIAHGVIELQQNEPEYGAERRRLRVQKLRGVKFRGGHHDFTILKGGVNVYPRLVAAEHVDVTARGLVSSGVDALDTLLGGGLHESTTTLLVGPSGGGKSVVASQFAHAAASRGQPVAMFTFDERRSTLLARAEELGTSLHGFLERGTLTVQQIDPAELSPGEIAAATQSAVEDRGARLVIIDSLNGYLNAMPGERYLPVHLHELATYLAQKGVTTIMTLAQHGLVGTGMSMPVDVSYVADTVVLFRYFEAAGRVRKAVSVIKSRLGPHEMTIRELMIGPVGVRVGPPLEQFRGVLSGVPTYEGRAGTLMETDDARC